VKRTLLAAAFFVVTAAPPAAAQSLADSADFADMLQTAAESIARMKAAHKQVADRVDEARSEKDVVKLNCVNEKLTQVKALVRVAEQAESALREAVAAKDDGADAEYAKIGIARSKVEGLRGDADQCTGQMAYMVDEKTTVEVEQPSSMGNEQQLPSLGVATRAVEVASAGMTQDSMITGGSLDGGSGLGGNLGSFGGAGTNATAGSLGGSSGEGGGSPAPAFVPPPVRPPPASPY
jgi:hypothetical protein